MRAVIVSQVYADPAARGKLRALAGRGVVVTVAVPERVAGGRRTTFEDDAGIRIVPIPVAGATGAGDGPGSSSSSSSSASASASSSAGRPSTLRWSRRALARLIREFEPDVIQVEEDAASPAAAAVRRIGRRLRRPYVLFVQESLPVSRGFFDRRRRGRTLQDAAGLIAANHLALALADGDEARPQLVAPQLGLTLPAAAARPAERPLAIGFAGRLVPEKGLDLLMRACVKIHGSWTLTVAGSGPAQEELEALAERLGIASRVTWLGALTRARLAEVWPRLDCIACPSRATPQWIEVVGRTPMEAMAHGIPAVVTRTGALPEVVGDGGIVVDEEDVAGLAQALERLCTDPAERARLGAQARQRVLREYTDAAVADKTLRIWTTATA